LLLDETCDVMLAGKDTINQMIMEGTFINRDLFPYLDELFAFCENSHAILFTNSSGVSE
jgi:hypothetical protein